MPSAPSQVTSEKRRRIPDMGLMQATGSRSAVVRWAARFVVILASWILIGGVVLLLFFRFGNG